MPEARSAGGIERALAADVPSLEQSTRELDRVSYSRDLWPRHHIAVRDGALPSSRPALIVWPKSTEEVARVVARCASEGVPIAPFGAGSGVCGGTLPDARTVVLDLKKMSRVRRLDGGAARVIDVEAGAMGIRLEEDLAARGHTLGHFPSSILCSTVGGWVAARSAGQCSGMYGKIEDMIVSLECVLGRGEVVRLKRRLNGPDLTPILTGSEGILGVVTSAELRLFEQPEARQFGAFAFPSLEAGYESMREMFQAGLRPAVARLYDAFDSFMARRGAVSGKRKHESAKKTQDAGLKQGALRLLLRAPTMLNGVVDLVGDKAFGGAMLVLVFEGPLHHGMADLARASNIARRNGARELGEAPARHWFKHRYAVSYRQAPTFMAGAFSDTMEVAAPWSRLGELYEAVRGAMRRHVFVMAHLSHAYPDGCSIYFTFAGSAPTRAAAEALYDATWRDAMDAAIGAGGTLSHHHGVGRSKAPKLGAELGLGVQIVQGIRGALDPAGIFNPGNLLPQTPPRRLKVPPSLPSEREPRFDHASLLLWANAGARLGDLEDLAAARGMTLGLRDLVRDKTLGAFIAEGGPGAPDAYEDPADHFVAGFTAELLSGDELVVRPGPRRAVGPDLLALFWGTGARVGAITSAHVRLHRNGMRARAQTTAIDRNPPQDRSEREVVDRVLDAACEARFSL